MKRLLATLLLAAMLAACGGGSGSGEGADAPSVPAPPADPAQPPADPPVTPPVTPPGVPDPVPPVDPPVTPPVTPPGGGSTYANDFGLFKFEGDYRLSLVTQVIGSFDGTPQYLDPTKPAGLPVLLATSSGYGFFDGGRVNGGTAAIFFHDGTVTIYRADDMLCPWTGFYAPDDDSNRMHRLLALHNSCTGTAKGDGYATFAMIAGACHLYFATSTEGAITRVAGHGYLIESMPTAWQPSGPGVTPPAPADRCPTGNEFLPQAPSIHISATPSHVTAGEHSSLDWNVLSVVDSCTASGGWSGAKPTAGTASVGPIIQDTPYTLQCVGPGGSSTATAVVTFNVPIPPDPTPPPRPEPTVTLTLNGTPADLSVPAGSVVEFAWQANDADFCAITTPWYVDQARPLNGSGTTPPINDDRVITITCGQGLPHSGGTHVATATRRIFVAAPVARVTAFEVTPRSLPDPETGMHVTVTWTSASTLSCTGATDYSGPLLNWSGNLGPGSTGGTRVVEIPGAVGQSPLGNIGLWVICNGVNGGQASSDPVTVHVAPPAPIPPAEPADLSGITGQWRTTENYYCTVNAATRRLSCVGGFTQPRREGVISFDGNAAADACNAAPWDAIIDRSALPGMLKLSIGGALIELRRPTAGEAWPSQPTGCP